MQFSESVENDDNFFKVKSVIALSQNCKSNSQIALCNDSSLLAILTILLPLQPNQINLNLEIFNYQKNEGYIKIFEKKLYFHTCYANLKFSQNNNYLYIYEDSNPFGMNFFIYSTASKQMIESQIDEQIFRTISVMNFQNFNLGSIKEIYENGKNLHDRIGTFVKFKTKSNDLIFRIHLFDYNQVNFVIFCQNNSIYTFYKNKQGLKLFMNNKLNFKNIPQIKALELLQLFSLYQLRYEYYQLIYIPKHRIIRKLSYSQSIHAIKANDIHLIVKQNNYYYKISLLNFSIKKLNNLSKILQNSFFQDDFRVVKAVKKNQQNEEIITILE